MKTTAKPNKPVLEKPKVKSNLKAAFGSYKERIVEKDDCWTEDIRKTIAD